MKKRHERQRFTITILFTLVALIFMVTCNFITFYNNAVSNMLAVGKRSLKQETEQLNSYLTKGMDVLQVTSITLEYMMQHGQSKEEIEKFLLEESERYKEDIDQNFTGIYGVFNGNYIDGIGWKPDKDYVPQEREWYIAAKKAGGKPVIVSPYLDAQTGTVMISVSRLLYDNESVISLDIVLKQVQIITKDIKLNDMGYGFIIDKEGLVVAHSNEKEAGKNYQKSDNMNYLLQRIYENQGDTFNLKVKGENCTVFTDNVMDDWYVAMIISNTKLYHDIRMILMQNIVLCALVFAVITFFCTRTFKRMQWHMKKEEESRMRVESMNETIMRTLARTIDAKDRYTNGHSQRVAKYTLELAKRMGKSEEEQKNIYYAALLHDVGKISIPDSIINKPSRLTDEEFARIKLHTTSGYYILRDVKENELIAQAAKWHHERFDGRGYPNGLSGKNIPEVARIIGVADSYDAMTSNRSYRSVMPQEKVRDEIEKGKGTQFDAEIADVMLQMIDEDKEYQMRQKGDYGWNILAVDDEPMNLELLAHILKDEPRYRVYKKNSVKEAVEELEHINPDVVLLDIQMPEMNGFEVYEQIRKVSNVPVVFLTADKNLDTIRKANELGIEDYLAKPFMPQALLEILHNILREEI